MTDFGDYLRRHLKTSGLRTQLALSEAIGMDYGQLNKIFTGKTQRPEIETLQKIAPKIRRPLAEVMAAAGYPPTSEARADSPPVQLALSDPDERFDPEAIVRWVEAQPGVSYQERLRRQRERRSRDSYVRFCISIFRSLNMTANAILGEIEALEDREGTEQHV